MIVPERRLWRSTVCRAWNSPSNDTLYFGIMRCSYGVATHFRRLRHPRVRRKIPCVSFFQSTKWHFTHGFGKLVCTTGKTCDDDVLRGAAGREKFPVGFLGEFI